MKMWLNVAAVSLMAAAQPETRLELNAPGPLTAILGTHRVPVAKQALGAWVLDDGMTVAYAARDGAGGFENQGQALYLYDLRTNRRRKILSETFLIDGVQEAKTSAGKKALLVDMHDGGLGADHVAVADPLRGEVLRVERARIIRVEGDSIEVGLYRPEDVDRKDAQPYKTERYDLKELLKRPVITAGAR